MNQRSMSLSLALCGLSLLGALTLTGCETGHRGKILAETDPDLVGKGEAGAPTFDRLVEGAVEKILNRHIREFGRTKKLNVAFVMFENRGAQELLDWRDQIYEWIDTKINKFSEYQTVSQRFIDAGMKDAGIGRVEQLFVPAKRRKLLASLEQQKSPADALLFATLTTGGTAGAGNARQGNYTLTMELIDIATGRNLKESERIRKIYVK